MRTKSFQIPVPLHARVHAVTKLILAVPPLLFSSLAAPAAAEPLPVAAEVRSASIDGQFDGEKARLVIQADLKGLGGESAARSLYGASFEHGIRLSGDRLLHGCRIQVEGLQGGLREIVVAMSGSGSVGGVTGKGLEEWSVRQTAAGARLLVLRLAKSEKPVMLFTAEIQAETLLSTLEAEAQPLTFTLEQPTLAHGYVRIDAEPGMEPRLGTTTGVIPIEPRFLPEGMRPAGSAGGVDPLAFRFQGMAYALPIKWVPADPESRGVVLSTSRLTGKLTPESGRFTFSATARVRNPKGGTLRLLSGGVALTGLPSGKEWRLRHEQGAFLLVFDRAGEFPLELTFDAAVRQVEGWNELGFTLAASPLQPFEFEGPARDAQFRLAGTSRPEWSGGHFTTFLPPGGEVRLGWKESKAESEGALFFAAEGLSQIGISPGVMRQVTLLDFRVLQGELHRVTLLLRGAGEVTRVQGPQVLSWAVEPSEAAAGGGAGAGAGATRRLVVQLNQGAKEGFSLQVQTETPLGAFPQAVDAVRVRPEGAIRFGGSLRVVNEGAVRLEVLGASGLSQIPPEQFPQTDAAKALLLAQSTQAFAYRFSGGEYELRIQADNILPELSVSQILAYHLGETELSVDADLEVDVREAPLRELFLRIPTGYTMARINASGLTDSFITDAGGTPAEAQLRIVYGAPVSGRQVVSLRLEKNSPLGEASWRLPRIEVLKAKSVRGHVGVSADAGFRLSPAATQGVTEIATAFFPRKIPGLQSAFRLNDPGWQASVNVERIPQSIQADVFHLFSVGEGIAYGSSLMNYVISGAPISSLKIALSNEYFNVEFTGKEIRNWQKIEGGYLVQLHTPVSGTYTLLAAYERPFKPQGETLLFTGARPLDAQAEQGHTVVVSTHQFQVTPASVSAGLTPLEPAEVPAEYRLFFDAPILAAYRYSARPFDLQLQLRPLTLGETVKQVVDRATLVTRVSKEGQIVTEAHYFVKNKGTPTLRLLLPEGMELWSVTVNGTPVVPVTDGRANLIPLPQQADPNALNDLQVKVASKGGSPGRLTVAAPSLSAPVLLSEWRMEPEATRRLVFRSGPIPPESREGDGSGFAGLLRLVQLATPGRAAGGAFVALGLLAVSAWTWRLATGAGVRRRTARHLLGGIVALGATAAVSAMLAQFALLALAATPPVPSQLRFVVPIQPANSALAMEIASTPLRPTPWGWTLVLWPAGIAMVLWGRLVVSRPSTLRTSGILGGWTLTAWAALRAPGGAPALFGVLWLFLLLHGFIPALRRWLTVPRPTAAGTPGPTASGGAGAAATAALVAGLLGLLACGAARADSPPASQGIVAPVPPPAPPSPGTTADTVVEEIRVEGDFAFARATVQWQARSGETLPVVHAPGILTRIDPLEEGTRLVHVGPETQPGAVLVAGRTGLVTTHLEYQVPVTSRGPGERGFVLPSARALVHRTTLRLAGMDVDLASPQIVSWERREGSGGTNSVFDVVLSPESDAWIGWRPRARDTRREKPVFYVEMSQLYIPGPGLIEGIHQAQIRPAQGELSELAFLVPAGATITDVTAPGLSTWRFDPASRQLRLALSPGLSKPFTVGVKSQIATGPLPLEQGAGLLAVSLAAGEVGLVGVATGSEVQLDDVQAGPLSGINLEDFPAGLLDGVRGRSPGLTLRRAFRYSDPRGSLVIKASPVEADVRIESQQTLSLGEDRVVLAVGLDVAIARAGIFKLSFPLPAGLDVETISGGALSHWTELKTDTGRVVTLHLKTKTEGQQQFMLTLAGSGLRSAAAWEVPRIEIREAAKQRGQLSIVPEQGMRLQVGTRDGVTQLDPAKAGLRQKGVLAFRLLQAGWRLALEVERVEAWTQVTSLQHVKVGEAFITLTANLQYDIDNSGVKSLRVHLPPAADGVRFKGELVADFRQATGQPGDAPGDWEIKLSRRAIGKLLLQATCTLPLAERAAEAVITGIEAQGVNLQRGFVSLQSEGRLEVRVDTLPASLQVAEWQSIPRLLQQDASASAATYTFRLVEPAFRLPVQLQRHEAARLLPARVNDVTLTSVIADDGMTLTQVKLSLLPGDKQLLRMTLPPTGRFWFAFVNQNSVWSWTEKDQILIPLEQHSRGGDPVVVEVFYSSPAGSATSRALDLSLLGPRFDLPLENITWRVFLKDSWKLRDWSGTLQLQDPGHLVRPASVDSEGYLRGEITLQKEKSREAERFLSLGNSLLEKGDPEQARRAFESAYGMSQHDAAFNEDARVQLHNLKMQQAIVGLNVRQARVAGESGGLAAAPRTLRDGTAPSYTQQEAKQLIERNSAEENAVQSKLVERLIQQQEAVAANPAAIRASVPEQGRLLTFTRSLQMDAFTDLHIGIRATPVAAASGWGRIGVLAGLGLLLAISLRLFRPSGV